MEKNIQCILLRDDKVLIGEVQELLMEKSENLIVKLSNLIGLFLALIPAVKLKSILNPWLTFTNQDEILIRSADVLTFVEPNGKLVDEYLAAIA